MQTQQSQSEEFENDVVARAAFARDLHNSPPPEARFSIDVPDASEEETSWIEETAQAVADAVEKSPVNYSFTDTVDGEGTKHELSIKIPLE